MIEPLHWTHGPGARRRSWRFAAACVGLLALGCDKSPTAPPPPPLHRTAMVEVADSLGAPAAGVSVLWVSERDSAGFAILAGGTTDANGRATAVLIEGEWGVHGRLATSRWVTGATFDVPGRTRPAVDTIVVRLSLHTASIADGRVRLGGRTDHSGVVVDCPPVPTLQVTGATGDYRMDLLPPGHWTITMFKTGFKLGLAPIDVTTPGSILSVPEVLLISDPLP